MTEHLDSVESLAPHYRVGWKRFIPRIAVLASLYAAMTGVALWMGGIEHYIGGALLYLVAYFIWIQRCATTEQRLNQEGVRRMAVGDFIGAGELFESLCRRPVSKGSHMMLIFNRAVSYQCVGDFDSALALYRSVLGASGRGPRKVMAAQGDLLRARIAEAFAWRGDLDTAEALLLEVGGGEKAPGARVAPEAIMALRRGQAATAMERIESGWSDAEALMRGIELKPLRILWAFALQGMGRERDEAFAHQLAELSPHDLELSRWCGTHWPQLATFLDALAKKSPAS